jgi:hypothetical protein
VAGAAVENHWLVLPGNLLGFHAWLPPSEIKETSVIKHITLLPNFRKYNIRIHHAYIPFNYLILKHQDKDQRDKT